MRVLILVLLSVLAAPVHAAYKCTGADGKVQYTETPCPAGTTGSEVRLQPNTMDSSGTRAQPAPQSERPAQANLQAPAGAAVCPSPLDIRNLETTASSVALGRMEREFFRDEVRRARACGAAGNSYTADDWRRIKDGQSAQSNVNPQQRRAERRTVEDIHASAAPAERQRILAERAAAVARGPNAIAECDGSGCWDGEGVRYNRAPGNERFVREDGALCRAVDNRMRCN